MGYYVINNLIKERINNMSKETLKETVDTQLQEDQLKLLRYDFE